MSVPVAATSQTDLEVVEHSTGRPPMFNYSCLDAADRAYIEERVEMIRLAGKSMAEMAYEVGGWLSEIKVKVGHGNFLPWLRSEFSFSESTANNYMRAYRDIKSANIGDLKKLKNLNVSAIYRLGVAEVKFPETVHQDVPQNATLLKAPANEKRKEPPVHRVRPHDATRQKDLETPPQLSGDEDAQEAIRIWIKGSHAGIWTVIASEMFDEPSEWGILLADVAQQIADALAQNGFDKQLTLSAIVEVFTREVMASAAEAQSQ